jgi:multisubunit Na+/H+ antiporter MnhB subunit
MLNERTFFAVAIVASVFLVLFTALSCLTLKKPIPKSISSFLKWLILVLVGLYLTSQYGLEGWRAVWFGR